MPAGRRARARRPGAVGPVGATAALMVHDSAGRLVRRLPDGALAEGPHAIRWDSRDDDGANVSPGVYFTNLVAGTARESKKLVVVN